jgi:hypothetical protein
MRRVVLLAPLAAVIVAVALSGCASAEETVKQGEAKVAQGCPSLEVAAEEKCNSPAAIQEAKREQHDKQVESEAHEAEGVLKKRHAEELANAAEGR